MTSENLEKDTISLLIHNINEKVNIMSKSKKEISTEKHLCNAAVKYTTIGSAFKDLQNNIKVYLLKEEKNGNFKTYAYSRCSKTQQDGCDFCHLHFRTKQLNSDGLKIFEKDILPNSDTEKSRWLAKEDDLFFENMGKRGAKKKMEKIIIFFQMKIIRFYLL